MVLIAYLHEIPQTHSSNVALETHSASLAKVPQLSEDRCVSVQRHSGTRNLRYGLVSNHYTQTEHMNSHDASCHHAVYCRACQVYGMQTTLVLQLGPSNNITTAASLLFECTAGYPFRPHQRQTSARFMPIISTLAGRPGAWCRQLQSNAV